MSKTILLIHGAWLTEAAWDRFKARYEEKGYTVAAPAWPYQDAPIDELRAKPDKRLRKLTIRQLADHHARLAREMAEKPIIIGHSFGGLIAQLLLDRGLGACGVVLSPAMIAGVLPPPRVLASAAPVLLDPLSWNKTLTMSYEHFASTFANTLPEDEKRDAYARFIAPTPGRIYWLGALGDGAGIRRGNPERPPLLLVSAQKDLTITPSAVKAAYRIQKKSPALTEYIEFKGRSHFLFREQGWEEVADFCLAWAIRNQVK